jgi:hypothetical protein
MLPSLIRLCVMMEGSRRESVADIPPELPGAFPPMKLLIAACLLTSCSSSCLRFRLTNKNAPTPIAIAAITPTTTPAAMPALFGPALSEVAAVVLGVEPAVMVCV